MKITLHSTLLTPAERKFHRDTHTDSTCHRQYTQLTCSAPLSQLINHLPAATTGTVETWYYDPVFHTKWTNSCPWFSMIGSRYAYENRSYELNHRWPLGTTMKSWKLLSSSSWLLTMFSEVKSLKVITLQAQLAWKRMTQFWCVMNIH